MSMIDFKNIVSIIFTKITNIQQSPRIMRFIKITSFILLYLICMNLVINRIYQIFVIDNGVIFGDVTFHFYPAGMRIIEGQSPYESEFITHPPLILLIFGLLVLINPTPIIIGLTLMSLFFFMPIISYKLGKEYLSEPLALIFSWIMTLNPLTTYAFITLIDDDPIIMIGIMLFSYYYPKNRFQASVIAGLFGAMKFIPLAIGIFFVLFNQQIQRNERLRLMLIQIGIFGAFIVIGTIMWGTITLTRILHYETFNSVKYAAMNPYHVLYVFRIFTDEEFIKIIAHILGGLLLLSTTIKYWHHNNIENSEIPQFIILLCFVTYVTNATTSYMYYTWILPFLILQMMLFLKNKQYLLFCITFPGIHVFGHLVSEWANYTWAYSPDYIIWAYVGSIYVWCFIIFEICISIWATRKIRLEMAYEGRTMQVPM